MELARRKHLERGGGGGGWRHNMKTLSDVSRKAHSNVLSLAREASVGCGAATSGRQDFRQLSFESRIRLGQRALQPGLREGQQECKERSPRKPCTTQRGLLKR